jgi:hypothetical protein
MPCPLAFHSGQAAHKDKQQQQQVTWKLGQTLTLHEGQVVSAAGLQHMLLTSCCIEVYRWCEALGRLFTTPCWLCGAAGMKLTAGSFDPLQQLPLPPGHTEASTAMHLRKNAT